MNIDNIIINIPLLKKGELSISQIMSLYAIKYKSLDIKVLKDDDYLELQKLGYLKYNPNKKSYIIREKTNILLENMQSSIITDYIKPVEKLITSKPHVKEDYDINLFRDKWKGLARGSMGGKNSCKEKMNRWMKENPEYSYDDVLKAADIYIDSLNNNYTYLQRADYFIFKKEGKDESSRLSAYVDEIDLEQDDGDWTATIN